MVKPGETLEQGERDSRRVAFTSSSTSDAELPFAGISQTDAAAAAPLLFAFVGEGCAALTWRPPTSFACDLLRPSVVVSASRFSNANMELAAMTVGEVDMALRRRWSSEVPGVSSSMLERAG